MPELPPLTAADVAHLEPGMTATIRFQYVPHPVTSVLHEHNGMLLLAAYVVRHVGGTPGDMVTAIDSPKPPTPVGQRRRGPNGQFVIAANLDIAARWVIYDEPEHRGRYSGWRTDDAVADWPIITDTNPDGHALLNLSGINVDEVYAHLKNERLPYGPLGLLLSVRLNQALADYLAEQSS